MHCSPFSKDREREEEYVEKKTMSVCLYIRVRTCVSERKTRKEKKGRKQMKKKLFLNTDCVTRMHFAPPVAAAAVASHTTAVLLILYSR